MKTSISVFLLFFVACFLSQPLPANTAGPVSQEASIDTPDKTPQSLEEKFTSFSQKKQRRIKKRLHKLKDLLHKRQQKEVLKGENIEKESATSGVTLGLIIILAGALIALLGFAGIADFLVTIGLVILIVGLILWLVDRL